jgi:hypothetical protein
MVLSDFHEDLHHFGSTKSGSFERTPLVGEKKVVKLWNRANRE